MNTPSGRGQSLQFDQSYKPMYSLKHNGQGEARVKSALYNSMYLYCCLFYDWAWREIISQRGSGWGGLQLWAYVLSDYFMVEGQHRKWLCRGVWKPLIYSLGQCTQYEPKEALIRLKCKYSVISKKFYEHSWAILINSFFFFYGGSGTIVW